MRQEQEGKIEAEQRARSKSGDHMAQHRQTKQSPFSLHQQSCTKISKHSARTEKNRDTRRNAESEGARHDHHQQETKKETRNRSPLGVASSILFCSLKTIHPRDHYLLLSATILYFAGQLLLWLLEIERKKEGRRVECRNAGAPPHVRSLAHSLSRNATNTHMHTHTKKRKQRAARRRESDKPFRFAEKNM